MPGNTGQRPNPRKLLLSKWTAVHPVDREKHFIVRALCAPVAAGSRDWAIELEAVYSRRVRRLPWQALLDTAEWRQGWH